MVPALQSITLFLCDIEEDGRTVLLDGPGGPQFRTMTWSDLGERIPEGLNIEAVLCQASHMLSRRRGLLTLMRRAYPEAPFFSFARLAPAPAEPSMQDLGLDAHITVPIAADTLRMLIARECRLRWLARRHREALSRMREQSEQLDLLIETAKASNSLLDPSRVMQMVMDRTQEFLGVEAWSLYLIAEGGKRGEFEMTRGGLGGEPTAWRLPADQGVAGWIVRHRRPAVIDNAAEDPRWDGATDRLTAFQTHSLLGAPLISRGRIIGVVELLNKRGGGVFTEQDVHAIQSLMEQAAIAIENAILFKKLEDLSVTDDLTRLYNARFLNQFLHQEVKRSKRYGYAVSLIFLDLDGFKRVNDSYGHLTGGRTLAEVGRIIRETVRETDIVSRYGGDEFAVVLPQTGVEGAMTIAERIRQAIAEAPYRDTVGVDIPLTASIGIACFPENGESREELISQADRAMYGVKERNKNGVALAAALLAQ